jgi:hypothetical protein
MTKLIGLAAPLIGLGLLAGCKDRTDREQTTTVTGAVVPSTTHDGAIARIVAARCARELTCNNIGSDKKFASQDICAQKIRVDMKDDLNATDCPGGVDQKELDECLAQIKSEDCNNPIDKIERLGACRTSDMCLKTRAPTR